MRQKMKIQVIVVGLQVKGENISDCSGATSSKVRISVIEVELQDECSEY